MGAGTQGQDPITRAQSDSGSVRPRCGLKEYVWDRHDGRLGEAAWPARYAHPIDSTVPCALSAMGLHFYIDDLVNVPQRVFNGTTLHDGVRVSSTQPRSFQMCTARWRRARAA